MLDIKWIRENQDALARAIHNRAWLPDETVMAKLRASSPDGGREIAAAGEDDDKRRAFVTALVDLDARRRDLIQRAEAAQQKRNAASAEIGKAKAKKDETRAAELMAEVTALKATMQAAEEQRQAAEAAVDAVLALIPNVPLDDVPVGPTDEFNIEYRKWGKAPAIANPKEHYQLGEAMGQMDFATAAKLSGTRFTVLKAGLARMERALGQFMLDLHTTEHGYTEIAPPLLVKDEAAFGTAQLPKFESDLFATAGQMRFWLIPTAEVPLTNLVRESVVNESDLPLRYTALTPCFRSEAGAAGRDTRGMLRQHQFDKVELVSITTPEKSRDEHERMLSCAEEVLKRLGIHHRVMVLSTGDMGFAAQKTYDIEVWLPGQGTYREISSCSVCGDFQARRMQARYRPKDAKGNRLVHTLNGSGVAVGRALIAVMENYQNEDGSITVPDVLRPYMNGMERVA